MLCEAKTGYVFNFQVYLGKEHGQLEQHLARRVVKHLILPIENKFHHLFMDNFYCDPHLFLELERKQVLACGTVRANREGFPKDIVLTSAMERRMHRGDYIWRCHGNLVAMAWYDRHSVYLISTIHPPESIGARHPIPCPPAQCAYQEFMGGVDLADQIQQSFTVIRKSNKAWKKLFSYGIEVCLLTSFTIMKKVRQSPQDFLALRIAIVHHLVEEKCFRTRPGRLPTRPLADLDARRLNRQYHQIDVEVDRRLCCLFQTVCVTCERKPLHLHTKRNCWEKWQKLVEYWR